MKPLEVPISLASRPAEAKDRQFVFAATVLLCVVFMALVPFTRTPLPEFNAFVPSVSALMLINDLITSVLLYAQCLISPSRRLLLLSSGYLFTAIIIVPHALTFPGAFTTTGLLGAGEQTSAWLYFSAHVIFAGTLVGYARLKNTDRQEPLRPSSARFAIVVSVAVVLALAIGLILLTTAGQRYLPALLVDRRHAVFTHLFLINGLIVVITVIALTGLWTRRSIVLDYWLMLTSVALIMEETLFSLTAVRFELGYYAGRVFWLISSIVVLTLLIQETTRLYTGLARANMLLERERENKLSNARAIIASIAHEVRQPLTAITASGGAALEYLAKAPPDSEMARAALARMMNESYRASEIFNSIRTLFERGDPRLEPIDLNEIVRDVLKSMSAEFIACGVAALSRLGELPIVEGEPNQLRQVVFNLAHNAIEAMQTTVDRKRELRISTERRQQSAIILMVEDTGPGIGPADLDGIFNAFVTTKPHGMGLGLAICRQIVEHHGGELVVSSDGKSGARFQVILPVASTDRANV